MSVMLTATKSVVRKKSARAKSASKKKTVRKPKESKAGPHVSGQNVKTWQWSVLSEGGEEAADDKEEVMTLTFRKDTMEIWVNDMKATVADSFAVDSEGAVVNFDCNLQKGAISTCRNEIGELEQVLTLETPDGPIIVE